MPPSLVLRPLVAADHEATARLLHHSLVHWYESRLRQGARFGEHAEPFRLFPEVYAALDPGEAIAACDAATGTLLGVCFVHPRPTHIAVGIVATAPEAQGRGVARAMLAPVLEQARRTGRPARLVSSLLNLDSFSLYSRLGFAPHTIFQDLALTVPETGLKAARPPGADRVRQVTDPAEAGRLAQLEGELQGIEREQDYALFLRNAVGDWRVWVLEREDGSAEGFLVASHHPSCLMLGPGVAHDETSALALLWRALDSMRGRSVVFLVPSAARTLVHTCYGWGARNVELHAAQTTGPLPVTRGVAFPTFLPESG
jgi:GNAT superfamily N-acetyltransferase